jgi:hypothetical protein
VGKPGPDFLSTYVRAAGSDRVIQVPEYLPSLFSGHPTWREKTLFSLDQENMRRYEYGSPSRGKLLMTREEAGTWNLEEPATGQVNEARAGIMLHTFAALKARDFADTLSADAAGVTPDTTWVQVTMADGSTHRLVVGSAAPRSAATPASGESLGAIAARLWAMMPRRVLQLPFAELERGAR